MEITQGIQRFALPTRNPLDLSAAVPYSGVRLVTTMPTVVRVFADAPNAPAIGVAGVEVALYGTDSLGQPLPGSPLAASTGGLLFDSGSANVPLSERADDSSSLDVALPKSWMGAASAGAISLTAKLLPPAPFGSPVQHVACTDPMCETLAEMTLSGVTAINPGVTDIVPVQLTVNGSGPSPYSAFEWAHWLLPADLTIDESAGSVDITSIIQGCPSGILGNRCSDRASKNSWALSAVEDFQSNYDNGSSPPMVGVSATTQSLGVEDTSANDRSRLLGMTPEPAAVVDNNRPLTDVAHEIGHMFGLQHAGFECGGGGDNDNDDTGQLGESWGPDNQGYINGIGFDIPGAAPYYPVVSGPGHSSSTLCATDGGSECGGNSPTQFFDFMSYCEASDPKADGTLGPTNTWISPRNWDYIATFASCELMGGDPFGCHQTAQVAKWGEVSAEQNGAARDAGPAPVAEAGAGGKTRVYGYVDHAGTGIAIIDPTPTRAVLVGQRSPYTVALKGHGGRTMSRSGMLMTATHVDGPGGGPVLLLDGALPMRPGAMEMAILDAGKVVAVVKRPRHTPRVSRFALGGTRQLNGTTPLRVLWRAGDPDHVALTVSLDFSSDGGRVWRTVWSGPNTGHFALPRSYLTGTRDARLRLRVSDGFNQVMVVSHRFAIAPTPPVVKIISPAGAAALRPGATVLLTGMAADDSHQPLSGSALTWYAGTTKLGTGQLLLAKLPAQATRITLVARDRHGRTAQVSLPAAKPHKHGHGR
jgi:hypothetical protein